ncbi:hypothetical protein ACQQ2Q_22550, partial [Agrobacterium sp. ES01]|uniref:T1SS-143 repeat domain-containing protein n=1 Tax=Agrobacterium sp. ES01 TaxID=3420714 RepID=UPI003D0A0D89
RGGLGDDDRLFNYDVTTNKTGGTLAIAWGADNGDNESLTGAGNRSVAFTQAGIDALVGQGLTSRGDVLSYVLSSDGTILTAMADGRTVFVVGLSDDDSGSYEFVLVDTLDHSGAGEDQLGLNFQFAATDSDGDTATASFSVGVIDDTPLSAGTIFDRYVEEEELVGGNEDDTPGYLAPDGDGNYLG